MRDLGLDTDKEGNVLNDIFTPLFINVFPQKYKNCICHLDMHFLNIMIPDDAELIADKIDYTIIDWMNARLAPPVFDYARTYVIFNEFAKEVLDIYKTAVLPDLLSLNISEEDFFEAVNVCTILRSHEK